MKNLLIIISLFFSLTTAAQPGFTNPIFPGGDIEMYKFINKRLIYPKSAQKAGIEGRVVIKFVVSEKGDIGDVRVLKSLHPDCDSIAINIVKAMPRWISGKQRGKNAAITFNLPIIFRQPKEEIKGEIYTLVDTMPRFPGEWDDLYKFIRENLKYPIHACCEGPCTQGRVTVRFIVDKEGKIKYPKIIRGLGHYFDEEALRIVSIMPDWIPGRRNGETVNVYYHLPIVFRYPH